MNNGTNEKADVISDQKTFHQNVSIEGRVLINESLNNFDVSELCGFVSSSNNEKHLILKGKVFTRTVATNESFPIYNRFSAVLDLGILINCHHVHLW